VVKRASGVMIAPPQTTGDRRVARRVRVYCTVLDAIRNGTLPAGARLPSARQMAAEWGYARGAVEEAFAQLQIEGYVERRVGDGSYVTPEAAHIRTPSRLPETPRPLSHSAQQVIDRLSVYVGKPRHIELPQVMLAEEPLHPRAPLLREFPLETWRRLVTKAHGEPLRDHLAYGAAAGLPRLREGIARHLSLARGMAVTPQQIVVMNSPSQAFEMLARVLLEPGDTVWLEDPGHSGLVALYRTLHMHVAGVPLDEQGLNVQAGVRLAPDAAMVYFHPIAQYPLGVPTTAQRRAELLAWAETSGAWIVEGNFNDEVLYDRRAPGAMWTAESADRVFTLGTFEGIVYPSLRLAYLVVPERLVDVFVAMRGLLGDHANVPLQQALSWFIEEGHLATHLRHLRSVGEQRRAALRASVARHLPAWAPLGPIHAGFHACIHLPREVSDADVVRRMRERGVVGIAMSSGCIDAAHGHGIAIGFGAFDELTLDRCVAVIGQSIEAVASASRPYQGAGENR
jgi:GntR family transcriptional regulator / MocR family aminotransferase